MDRSSRIPVVRSEHRERRRDRPRRSRPARSRVVQDPSTGDLSLAVGRNAAPDPRRCPARRSPVCPIPATPANPPSPGIGAHFLNLVDNLGWIYGVDPATGTPGWIPLPMPPSPPSRSPRPLATPGHVAPGEPDRRRPVHQPGRQLGWVYAVDPITLALMVWEPLPGQLAATVTITDVAGATPATTPLAQEEVGDIVVNRTDNTVWAFGPDPVTGLDVWEPLTPSAMVVTITAVTGETPATNPPADRTHGDIYVNRADNALWVFGPDPITPGQDVWEPLTPAATTVTVTTTAGNNPGANPPTGAPNVGDVYINRTDSAVWMWAPDPTIPNAFLWEPLTPTAGNVWVTDVANEIPYAGAVAPYTPYTFPPGTTFTIGDRFVNRDRPPVVGVGHRSRRPATKSGLRFRPRTRRSSPTSSAKTRRTTRSRHRPTSATCSRTVSTGSPGSTRPTRPAPRCGN